MENTPVSRYDIVYDDTKCGVFDNEADSLVTPVEYESLTFLKRTVEDSVAVVPQIAGADLLYHEATFCDADEQSAAATRHSTASQAAAIAQEAGVGKLAIGHYSIRYREENQLLQEAREVFPETVLSDEMMQFSL